MIQPWSGNPIAPRTRPFVEGGGVMSCSRTPGWKRLKPRWSAYPYAGDRLQSALEPSPAQGTARRPPGNSLCNLLPNHSGSYVYGGSWFLCDAANYLVAATETVCVWNQRKRHCGPGNSLFPRHTL